MTILVYTCVQRIHICIHRASIPPLNTSWYDYNYTQLKGARARRRARTFFRILPAYTIIILDHHGVVIKFQRSKYAASTGSLRLQVE